MSTTDYILKLINQQQNRLNVFVNVEKHEVEMINFIANENGWSELQIIELILDYYQLTTKSL